MKKFEVDLHSAESDHLRTTAESRLAILPAKLNPSGETYIHATRSHFERAPSASSPQKPCRDFLIPRISASFTVWDERRKSSKESRWWLCPLRN